MPAMTESTHAPDSTEPLTNKQWKTFVGRVLNRTCPRCGNGALFLSRTKLEKQCSSCALVYRREQGGMTGQLYLTAVISQIFAAIMIGAMFLFTDWPPAVSIPIGIAILAVFGYWLLPKTIGLWVCVEFMTDVGNRESWALEENSDKRA